MEEKQDFDCKDFDIISYINYKFPNEQSLVNLDTEITKLKGELGSLNSELISAIHDHALVNTQL